MKDCIFCKIIKDEIPSKKIYEDDIVKVIMNINPEQNGDLLILLKRHAENFTKLTDEEKRKIEDLINEWIEDGLTVTNTEMKKEDAVATGAEAMFIERYPDIVTVYTIGDVSKEICMGPHVENTKVLGHFKIQKEEASSAGIRRIKAVLIN